MAATPPLPPSPDPERPPARGLNREVLDLALPALLSSVVWTAYQWINQFWIGRLPDATTAAAALSLAGFTVWAFNAVTMLVGVGLAALVGRYSGGGRLDAARYVGSQGIRWGLVLWASSAVVGIGLAPQVFAAADASAAVASSGTAYVRILYAGAFAPMTQAACDAVWRGHGTTRVPLVTSVLGLGLNAALDPLLIFGWGPVPGLALAGAALATVLASLVAAAVALTWLARAGHLAAARPPEEVLRLDRSTPVAAGPWPALDLSVGRRLARVGLPVTASGLFFVAIYVALSRTVNRAGGTAAQAGLGVGLRGEQVSWVVGAGFSAAASVLVARGLGAGRPDDASRAAWRSTWIATLGCLLWGVALYLGRETLLDVFLPSDHATPQARAYALEYWVLVAPCLAVQAWEAVLGGAFGGAGLTVPPMVASVVLTAVRIPLAGAAAFGLGLGVRGIWIVIAVTAALRGIVVALWFARGTWRHRTV